MDAHANIVSAMVPPDPNRPPVGFGCLDAQPPESLLASGAEHRLPFQASQEWKRFL